LQPYIQKTRNEKETTAINFLSWDIRGEGFPDWATEDDKKAIVYYKIAYLDCSFSGEELKIAKEIFEAFQHMVPLHEPNKLREKLALFLEKNFPSSGKNHPLLQFLIQENL
jgi:hypothetical protein